jgi:indole-3-glycerol phosphate synthase
MLRAVAGGLVALSVLAGIVSVAGANDALVRVYFDDLEHLKKVVAQFDDVAAWGGRRYADISVPQARLAELAADRRTLVSESGIRTAADVDRLAAAGVNTVLVGETLMRSPDVAATMDELFGPRQWE